MSLVEEAAGHGCRPPREAARLRRPRRSHSGATAYLRKRRPSVVAGRWGGMLSVVP